MTRRGPAAVGMLLSAVTAFALPVRTITTAHLDNWSVVLPGDAALWGWSLEETVLLVLNPSLSLAVKGQGAMPHVSGSTFTSSGALGGGITWLFLPGLYADLLYTGLWEAGSAVYSNDIEACLQYENALVYAGLRGRTRFHGTAFTVYGSAFAKYTPAGWPALWLSYTMVWENGVGADHALWTYAEISPAPILGLVLGGTAATFHYTDPITTRTQGIASSLIAGLDLRPAETLGFKYRLEHFLGDRDWNRTAHTVVADLRFP